MRTPKGYRRARGLTIHDLPRSMVVFEMANGHCENCGRSLTFRGGDPWHVVTIRPGKVRAYGNVQALCGPCFEEATAP